MAYVGWVLLLLLAQLHPLAISSGHAYGNLTHHSSPFMCRPDQANALLKLKKTFFFSYSTTTLSSWQAGSDCCLWEGVGCSNSSGHVITLDLSGFGLISYGIDPVLFNLTSLRLLDLSMNDFCYPSYDSPLDGLERLALLTHLNLSNSGIGGYVPISISKLTNLLSLDLSSTRFNIISDVEVPKIRRPLNLFSENYSFHGLVMNLNNLRELKLDGMFFSSLAEDCFKALAESVPHLQVLSLENCELQGHIGQSLSQLHFLVVINLNDNGGLTSGPFPEFFMDFLNLTVLQVSGINLEGWFPGKLFQSKNLTVLDLSRNLNLSGHMPNFSNPSVLEILRLDMTKFSYLKSSSFNNFMSLTELGLDGNFMSIDFLSSFGMLVSLDKLVLTRLNSLREFESIFSWIEGTKNLTSLEFSDCDFSVTIPSFTGNSKTLQSLVISYSNLTTQTLSAVADLNSLKTFIIVGSHFLGQLPSAIGNMSNLQRFYILDCQISGPIPFEIGALKDLTSLKLLGNGLSGTVPSSIANLTQLIELNLYDNYISGEIPISIFTLPALQYLDLAWNQLSGPIPEFEVISSNLKTVNLGWNKLTGKIPQSLFLLTSLTGLYISSNNLTGSVNLASLWKLEKLSYLVLSQNKLSVTDGEGNNSSYTYLSGLRMLQLASCNITKIPNFLTHVNHMASLDLSSNKIPGTIPKWIWERWNSSLKSLNLSRNMFTGIELTSYVISFSNYLNILDLSSNKLQGQIPMPSQSAMILDYSNNAFSSVLPNFTFYLSSTMHLQMSRNNVSGYLPHSICNSPLELIDLSYNNFRGQIPPCLMENEFMNILNLRENQFEGALPSNISSGCSLQTIDLHGNKVEGQIPKVLYNCTNLEILDLGHNLIADTFPSWLGKLLDLRVLILRSNQFHGSIAYLNNDQSGAHFSSLQILDLASNYFSGSLHPELFGSMKSMEKYNNSGQIIGHQNLSGSGFYQDSVTISYKGFYEPFEKILTTLTAIDLSDNALEGSIPASIGKLISLHVLNLSHNAFAGEIPCQLGGMTALESLDLSSNMLSGDIPQGLTNLTFLSILNLSNNQLEGKIPQSRQFETFQNSSFDANAGLCGPPLSKQCGAPDAPSGQHMKSSSGDVDIVLFLFVGVGFGVGFAAVVLVKLGWIKMWFHAARFRRT